MNIVDIDEAADRLRNANRVLVLGCSGSGKTTLSVEIARRFGLRHISMDREVFWLPGWEQRPKGEAIRKIQELIQEPKWVMDGTSHATLKLRLPRTDLAVWLRPSRLMSVWGVLTRWLQFRGEVRPGMAAGCPEKMDLEFLQYVWNFERDHSPRIIAEVESHGAFVPLLIIDSRRQMSTLLARSD